VESTTGTHMTAQVYTIQRLCARCHGEVLEECNKRRGNAW
jgi:hypothetical protein